MVLPLLILISTHYFMDITHSLYLSTSQDHDFGISVHDSGKHNSDK